MKLGSLFDGIGGWLLAAQKLGITSVWASEINPFSIAVTKNRFPDVQHLGNIEAIDGAQIEPVDIITMGSPCQNLSVAGDMKGFVGDRSGLFYEGIRIVREMRRATNGEFPKCLIWENVPGVFSVNKRRGFQTVLEEIAETSIPIPSSGRWANAGLVRSNKCTIAWRVLNAQHWGVPQRRKRVFLVVDFTDGRCAEEILFERESVSGHTSTGGEARKGNAAGTERGIGAAIGVGGEDEVAGTLDASYYKGAGNRSGKERTAVVVFDMTHANNPVQSYNSEVCHTLNARMGTGGNQVPVIAIEGNSTRPSHKGNGRGMDGKSCTLNTVEHHAVAYGIGRDTFNQGKNAQFGITINEELQPPLIAKGAGAVMALEAVRRLTPTECERLQGLPDGYTLIDDRTCSDTARYKALGNGMAQPCADFILGRVKDRLQSYAE